MGEGGRIVLGEKMTRQARVDSPSGIQHVISRGAGKRNIFEDDLDRMRYLEKLGAVAEKNHVGIYAWCLMGNHVHLLLACDVDSMESVMRSVNTSHAQWFNGRHGHVGPVFQGRYSSVPIETDAHLLECVRYIHRNPESAGMAKMEQYRWSSYADYLGKRLDGVPPICDTSLVLGVLDDFEGFHSARNEQTEFLELVPARPILSDGDVAGLAASWYGEEYAGAIGAMAKPDRDCAFRRLHGAGASIRQLERLTGIGRGAIQRAVRW